METEIPKEFLASKDKIPEDLNDYMDGVLIDGKVYGMIRPVSSLVEKIKEQHEACCDWPPDGCGIGIGSSYRDL